MKKTLRFCLISCAAVLSLFALTACSGTTLESISITTNPNKTEYVVGESFDAEGMVVTASYSDGTVEVIDDYTVDKTGPLKAEDTSITVSYQGKTAELKIVVKESENDLHSAYDIIVGEFDEIKAGVDNVIGITLKSTDVKGLGYDNVLVFFEVNSKPENANVTLTATDSNDNVVDLIETGFWGPSGGFELPNAYNETTDVTANFSTEGTYTFTIKVCTVDSGNNILSTVCAETITVNVSAAA